MISITRNNLKSILIKALRVVLVTALWVFLWDVVAVLLAKDNELMFLLLPRPHTVLEKWLEIAFTREFLRSVLSSLLRIMSGFIIGLVVGFSAGVLTYSVKLADWVLSPILKMIRAVPVVAITILFFSLFKSDTLPIVIVALMVIPLIWATVHDGLSRENKELSEMAKLYHLSPKKQFFNIKLPSLTPTLLTASVNALGLAWKSGIAAEVISEPNVALGTILMEGKGLIDFSTVYAITLTVVILSLVIEILLKGVCSKIVGKGSDINA